jgi:hypothetical protein
LPGRFPEDALSLLDAIIDDPSRGEPDLKQCLNAISQALPALENDHRYQRLVENY